MYEHEHVYMCLSMGPVTVIQQLLPLVSMAVDGVLYTPVPALFTAATLPQNTMFLKEYNCRAH